MIVWKLIYEDENTVEYYATKKDLLKDLVPSIDTDGELSYKVHKLIIKDKWDLVFQLKIAQMSKSIRSLH